MNVKGVITMISQKKTRIFVLIFIFCLLFTENIIAQSNCSIIDPHPSTFSQVSSYDDSRFGQAKFKARDNNVLDLYYYVPSNYSIDSAIVFVMHGSARNAFWYLEQFAPVAERYGVLAIAPEFPYDHYPSSDDYTLGVGVSSVPYTGEYVKSDWKTEENFLYSEIEHLFEGLKQYLSSQHCGYFILGHSAGGQFIHRMVTFLPNARIIRAVAANSGWYTLPDMGSTRDINYYMPYGIQGSPLDNASLSTSLQQELIVLVGENDTLTPSESSSVRGTDEAMFQGKNRNERGRFYFQTARQKASELSIATNWKLDEVPEAEHDFSQMVQSATWYLARGVGEIACTANNANSATNLVINEIHADPESSLLGDANNDGTRASQDDEFVEIVNTGAESICLSGWTLGDSSNKKRHIFPLGTKLESGQAIVIFGGGIPTGNFGGAIVQWAAHDGLLNLNNSGDGVRLYDSNGSLAKEITWGSCGDMSCATEHVDFSLEINQAIVRWPELTGKWVKHNSVSNKIYSPGTQVNGVAW